MWTSENYDVDIVTATATCTPTENSVGSSRFILIYARIRLYCRVNGDSPIVFERKLGENVPLIGQTITCYEAFNRVFVRFSHVPVIFMWILSISRFAMQHFMWI